MVSVAVLLLLTVFADDESGNVATASITCIVANILLLLLQIDHVVLLPVLLSRLLSVTDGSGGVSGSPAASDYIIPDDESGNVATALSCVLLLIFYYCYYCR